MAFRRVVHKRHAPCGVYGCVAHATHRCTVCGQTLCEDCVKGHVKAHAKRLLACVHG